MLTLYKTMRDLLELIIMYIIRAAVILISLAIHESAHALGSLVLGDRTARKKGRVSLNPLRHIDIIGFLMLLIVGFGWAKPVPVDLRRFRHPKSGFALTSLAGPLSNLLLAFIGGFFFLFLQYHFDVKNAYLLSALQLFFYYNCALAAFNLIPIPPLDGSRVVMAFLPDRYYYKVMQYEQYGILVMMLLLLTGILDTPLQNGVNKLMNLVEKLLYLLPLWG